MRYLRVLEAPRPIIDSPYLYKNPTLNVFSKKTPLSLRVRTAWKVLASPAIAVDLSMSSVMTLIRMRRCLFSYLQKYVLRIFKFMNPFSLAIAFVSLCSPRAHAQICAGWYKAFLDAQYFSAIFACRSPYGPRQAKTIFEHVRTAKANNTLRNRTVWSLQALFHCLKGVAELNKENI